MWASSLLQLLNSVIVGEKKHCYSFRLSSVQLFATPWTAACQSPPTSTISWSLLEFMSIESVMVSHHLILCLLRLWPLIFPSIRVFPNELTLHIRWLQPLEHQLQQHSFQRILISFRIDWFDLLAVQGTLKSSLAKFKSISSLVLSLLYGPTLTSIHDYWKNYSFDYIDICWQVTAF